MRVLRLFFIFSVMLLIQGQAFALMPVATDSRIRTYVYGENEVFRVIVLYGYQASIELSKKERIQTISIGDSSPFKITPAGNRIFIKPIQNDRVTNMTVLTDKRVYQFDLSSKKDEEDRMIYVARFYYPEEDFEPYPSQKKGEITLNDSVAEPARMNANPYGLPPGMSGEPPVNPYEDSFNNVNSNPVMSNPAMEGNADISNASFSPRGGENYNYSISGPGELAPLKVFDNGVSTFIKMPPNAPRPSLYAVSDSGKESLMMTRFDGDYMVVDVVLPRIALHNGPQVVCIFNDMLVP